PAGLLKTSREGGGFNAPPSECDIALRGITLTRRPCNDSACSPLADTSLESDEQTFLLPSRAPDAAVDGRRTQQHRRRDAPVDDVELRVDKLETLHRDPVRP